jgi:hypothetical protein
MTFAVAAEYGIAICIAAAALIRLSPMPPLRVVGRSSGRRVPEREPPRPNRALR